jgi:hypothetical protein
MGDAGLTNMSFTRRDVLGCSIAALASMLVVGCGGARTSVTQVWKAPIAAAPLKSVIIFATHMDEANRRVVEDGYVAALAKRDLVARQSYTLFPGEPPPRDQAREVVRNAGFEGIVVSRLRSVREKETYYAGLYSGGFWSAYYAPGWGYYSPGYVASDEVVSFDTTLWDARSGDQLVFAVTTETLNPSSGRDFVQSLTKTVLSALDAQRLLPPRRE